MDIQKTEGVLSITLHKTDKNTYSHCALPAATPPDLMFKHSGALVSHQTKA